MAQPRRGEQFSPATQSPNNMRTVSKPTLQSVAQESLTREEFREYLGHSLPRDLAVRQEMVGEVLVLHTTPEGVLRLLFFLRDNSTCLCKQLIDMCGVDYPGREKRFEVVYQLLSLSITGAFG